jgi:phosphotransferase system enzyme I (PtsP)
MASDPLSFLALVGMGLREFSMPAPFIPRTKALLLELDAKVARRAAREVLALSDSAAIRACLAKTLETITKTA